MYYVYILVDDKKDIYIGFSADLKNRLIEHKSGRVYFTRRLQNPELYYYEAYRDIEMAKQRERQLKKFKSSYVGLMKRIALK